MLFSGGLGKVYELWAAKALLQFTASVRASMGSQDYDGLQYLKVTRPIDRVEETLGCVSLSWSTDDEMDHKQRRERAILKKV